VPDKSTSIHDGTHDFNADPQGAAFMPAAFAQVVVVVTAVLVVKAEPDLFLVSG
jgi:hypothetical protein